MKTHGLSKTPEYVVYRGMIARCENPNHSQYARYGARGIKVCERWRKSFEDFLADMGKRPGRGYSIERINGSADYSPENCTWATQEQQCRNRPGFVKLTESDAISIRQRLSRGESIAALAREYGAGETTIRHVRDRNSWRSVA